MSILVGLSGVAGAGKSTTAAYLVEHHGFVEVSFAGPLKEAVRVVYNISESESREDQKEVVIERLGVSLRTLWQKIGTEIFRDAVPALIPNLSWSHPWVDNMRSRLVRLLGEGCRVVVSDVRFPDEADLIKEMGGKVWCVRRSALDDPDVVASKTTPHSSERADQMLLNADLAIFNHSDIPHIHASVDMLLEGMG